MMERKDFIWSSHLPLYTPYKARNEPRAMRLVESGKHLVVLDNVLRDELEPCSGSVGPPHESAWCETVVRVD